MAFVPIKSLIKCIGKHRHKYVLTCTHKHAYRNIYSDRQRQTDRLTHTLYIYIYACVCVCVCVWMCVCVCVRASFLSKTYVLYFVHIHVETNACCLLHAMQQRFSLGMCIYKKCFVNSIRSIFKWSTAILNSESILQLILTRAKESSQPRYLLLAGEKRDGFMSLSRVLR